jgi:acetyltransferase-like isoleucine patch superfamily enzyme
MAIYIHATAEVSEDTKIGAGSKIWHHAQIREGVSIGRECVIGKGVYIDHHVTIGDRVKVQNYVSVYAGVSIEEDVLLAPNCTFTNDYYPRAFNADWKIFPTLVKKGASIGANATILCGTTIGEYSMIGIGAAVTHDTLPHSLMAGNPARLRGFVCRCGVKFSGVRATDGKICMSCRKCGSTLEVAFVFNSDGVIGT